MHPSGPNRTRFWATIPDRLVERLVALPIGTNTVVRVGGILARQPRWKDSVTACVVEHTRMRETTVKAPGTGLRS